MNKNLKELKIQATTFADRNDNCYALVMRDGCDINDMGTLEYLVESLKSSGYDPLACEPGQRSLVGQWWDDDGRPHGNRSISQNQFMDIQQANDIASTAEAILTVERVAVLDGNKISQILGIRKMVDVYTELDLYGISYAHYTRSNQFVMLITKEGELICDEVSDCDIENLFGNKFSEFWSALKIK